MPTSYSSAADYLRVAQQLIAYWAARDAILDRAENMYYLRWLNNQDTFTGELYVDPAPYDVTNHIAGALGSAERTISVPPQRVKGREFQRSEKLESWLNAVDYWIDEHSDVPFARAVAFLMLLRGACPVRVLYVRDEEPRLRVQPRDWRYVFPLTHHGRCAVVAEAYQRTVGDVLDAWPEAAAKLPDNADFSTKVDWLEVWDERNRTYFVNGAVVLGPSPHELGCCPYHIAGGNRLPLTGAEKETLPFTYGAYYPWREKNRLVSLGAENVAAAAGEGAWLVRGRFDGEIDLTNGAVNQTSDPNADVKPIADRQLPPGFNNLVGIASAGIEQTTISRIASGVGGGNIIAAYAISLTQAANMVRTQPYTDSLGKAYEWVFRRVLDLAKRLGPEEVIDGLVAFGEGTLEDGRRVVKHEVPALTSDDIPETPIVRVVVKDPVPSNELQEAQVGQMALSSGVISRTTAAEKYFGVSKPLEEQNMRLIEEFLEQPEIKRIMATKLARQFSEDVDVLVAEEERKQQAAQQAAPPPGPPLPPEQPPMPPEMMMPMPEMMMQPGGESMMEMGMEPAYA